MRVLFLIPDIYRPGIHEASIRFLRRFPILWRNTVVRNQIVSPWLHVGTAFGGTLNIMRHCALVRSLGVDAVLCSPSGKDTYGEFNIVNVPFVSFRDARPDDLWVIPEFASEVVPRIAGQVIVYLQAPHLVFNNFDHRDPRIRLWTDSPFMLQKCQALLPGKEILIVPNIIDPAAFPFKPQSEREPGVLFAFPRKGPEFIDATEKAYATLGGKYWRFERIDGLTLKQLAAEMRRPQAFLASGDDEGCALPPQECMAAGIVVVGKSARGANFSMEHRKTAMVAETPEDAAASLRELEDVELREQISRNGHEFIRRYFPDGEPTQFWRRFLNEAERQR